MLIITIIYWFIKNIFYLSLLFVAAVIGARLWFEPVNGKCRCATRLDGKVAIVTGGNSGIGLEIARDLARRGATVVIASRDEKKSKSAVDNIVETTGNEQVHFRQLDLSKFSSVRQFAEDFNRTYDRLDILVNNAGVGALLPKLTEDGIEKITHINYVGPFLLTNLLLDKLIASKPSRIVIVSSKANEDHKFNPDDLANVTRKSTTKLNIYRTYANTKLCNILWAKALAKKLPSGVTANALHPGLVATNIFQFLPSTLNRIFLLLIGTFFKTTVEGAQTAIHLCVAPELEGITGEYFAECKVAVADKLTRDEKLVEQVWEDTLKLVKKE